MKNLILSIAGLLVVNLTHAQDTIYSRNGDVINGKVTEITQSEIKYKKASNPDGPTYTMGKEDVTLIQYKNGIKDVFPSNSNTSGNQQTQQQQPVVNNTTYYQNNGSNGYGYGYGGPRVRVNINPGMFMRGPGFYYGYRRPYFYGGYRHRRCW